MLISPTHCKLSGSAPIETFNHQIEPTGVSARGQRISMSLRARSFNMFLDKPVSHSNLTEFERSCLWLSPRLKDWRETPADWFDPIKSEDYTNQVSRLSSEFPDRHMIRADCK